MILSKKKFVYVFISRTNLPGALFSLTEAGRSCKVSKIVAGLYFSCGCSVPNIFHRRGRGVPQRKTNTWLCDSAFLCGLCGLCGKRNGSLIIPVIHEQLCYLEFQSADLTTLRSSVMTRLRRAAKASLQHSSSREISKNHKNLVNPVNPV